MTATIVTPVTLLTGFLGSGKTTLLNRLLRDPAAADSAVIVNEFGPVAIDQALVRTASENVVLLPSGCVCCQVAGDLVQALRDLYFKRAAGEIPPFRRALIETTGLADPAPLLRTLVELPLVAARYSLAGVATTVDAVHGMDQLDRHPEAVKQAAVADRLVMTKADLASPEAMARLEARLAALNPGAGRVRAAKGAVDANWLLETGLSRGAARLPDPVSWLNAGAYRAMVHDKTSVGILMAAGHHAAIHYEKYLKRGEPMPVAMVLGGDPLCFFYGGLEAPYGVFEIDVVGGLPVRNGDQFGVGRR